MKRILRVWLPIAASSTLVLGVVYLLVQGEIRMSGNDPQIQISEDLAEILKGGADPALFKSDQKVDIAKSLSAYYVIYDNTGNPVSGNGYLDGKLADLPAGVFDFTKMHGQD